MSNVKHDALKSSVVHINRLLGKCTAISLPPRQMKVQRAVVLTQRTGIHPQTRLLLLLLLAQM